MVIRFHQPTGKYVEVLAGPDNGSIEVKTVMGEKVFGHETFHGARANGGAPVVLADWAWVREDTLLERKPKDL